MSVAMLAGLYCCGGLVGDLATLTIWVAQQGGGGREAVKLAGLTGTIRSAESSRCGTQQRERGRRAAGTVAGADRRTPRVLSGYVLAPVPKKPTAGSAGWSKCCTSSVSRPGADRRPGRPPIPS